MELAIYDMDKKKVGETAWPESVLGTYVNRARIYQVVVGQLENRRQGNANVKTRHEVSGSTRKIVRQKGTGGARHGDIKAPLFVGGGRAFGPKTRDWSKPIPEKIRRGAMKDLLCLKKQEEKLWLLEKLDLEKPKTKTMAELFAKFGIPSGLVILGSKNSAVEKSIRNLARFKVAQLNSMSATDLLRYDHLIMTREAYDQFVKRQEQS